LKSPGKYMNYENFASGPASQENLFLSDKPSFLPLPFTDHSSAVYTFDYLNMI
jgi:hypothetical protein